MRRLPFPAPLAFAALAALAATAALGAQTAPTLAPVPAYISAAVVVTAMHKKSGEPLAIGATDLELREGKQPVAVTGIVPLTGQSALLELFVAIDDDTTGMGPLAMQQLQTFVGGLPPTTAVAIAYLRAGTVDIVQGLTVNHAAAAHALRLPSGQSGISPSPYESLRQLMANWPMRLNRRRQILLLSNGVEEAEVNNSDNPIVAKTLAQAEESDILIYGIWAGAAATAAPAGRGSARAGNTMQDTPASLNASVGSDHLTALAQKSGGAFYAQGNGTPTDLAPILRDIGNRMAAQFRVSFNPAAGGAANSLDAIKVETKLPDAAVTAQAAIFIRQ